VTTGPVRPQRPDWRWEGVDELRYKPEGTAPFHAITRQILFRDAALGCELRYFEIQAGGYSTLERHQHTHAVMILRGHGRALVGDVVYEVGAHDLVHVPAHTWHQFRAGPDKAFGFLCMVNAARDRPQLPTAEDLARLRSDPVIAAFIALDHPG
jgi:quercetin dioxygenase-like cupin family protein